jgi:hypothetical protein
MKSVKLTLNGLRRLIREAADEAEQLNVARPAVKGMFEDYIFGKGMRKNSGMRGSGSYLSKERFSKVTRAMDMVFDRFAEKGVHVTAQAFGQAVVEYLEGECDALTPEQAEKEKKNIAATNQKQGKLKGGDIQDDDEIASPSYDPALIQVVDAWVKENVNKHSEFDESDGQRKPKGQKTKGSLFDKFLKSTGLKSSKKKEIPDNAWELEDERAAGGGTPRRFLPRG